MNKKVFRVLVILLFLTVITFMGNNEVSAKNKSKIKFNKKLVNVKVGKKTTIKLKSVHAKVKWKVKDNKVAKIVNKKGKFKNVIIIKGKKEGKTVLIAKYRKSKYKINVKVNSKTVKSQNNVSQSVPNQQKPSIVTNMEMEIENSPIKMSEDGISIGVKIINNTNEYCYMDYAFGKLEKYENKAWKSIDVREMVSIEILGIINKKSYLSFTIGLNGKGGETFGYIDNLSTGHYRYTHTVKGEDGHTEDVSAEFDIIEGDQTPDKELDLKEELKLEVTNSPIKFGDDMHMNVRISSLKEGIFITGYEFGKLEILNGDKWQPVEIKDWYALTGLGNIQKDNPFIFSIGINTEREKSNVYIDNLIPGHYRYSHLAEMGSNVYLSDEFDIVE